MTASTISNGGHPRGSTKLDEETGHNCQMTHKEFQEFGYLVFGLDSLRSIGSSMPFQGFRQTDYSFLNMILSNFATITNLHQLIMHKVEGDCHSLA
jgi:hypothetical protein